MSKLEQAKTPSRNSRYESGAGLLLPYPFNKIFIQIRMKEMKQGQRLDPEDSTGLPYLFAITRRDWNPNGLIIHGCCFIAE